MISKIFNKFKLIHAYILRFSTEHIPIFRWIVFFIIILVSFGTLYCYTLEAKTQRENSYKIACELFDSNEYQKAREAFSLLGTYKDSLDYYKNSLLYLKYDEALSMLNDGQYFAAYEMFQSLNTFEDSPEKAEKSLYAYAVELYNTGKYESAFGYFQELNDYSDSNLYVANITLLLQEKMQKRIFDEASRLFDEADYNSALEQLSKIADYPDTAELKQRCEDILSRRRLSHTISAGIHGSIAISKDGTLEFIGGEMVSQVAPLIGQDIVSVACFGLITIGLKVDGSVVSTAVSNVNIGDWTDIIAVDAGRAHVVGLRNNGKVVASGHNGDGQLNVKDWEEITAIATGWRHTVGLAKDQTVKITGYANRRHRNDVKSWTGVVAVAAGGGAVDSEGNGHTVGLLEDGTVVAAGDISYGQCDVYGKEWTDIVAIAAGDWHTVGLKADGTVVATGTLSPGTISAACDVGDWENIVAIAAGTGYTLGLTADGTIMATGFNAQHQRPNSGDWTDIMIYNEWDSIKNQS